MQYLMQKFADAVATNNYIKRLWKTFPADGTVELHTHLLLASQSVEPPQPTNLHIWNVELLRSKHTP